MPYIIDSITAETINVNQELKVNGIPITPSGGGSFTGGTVTGQTQFTNGLTATTISATTYQNLPGGGIEGSNYIYVAANGTDTENATELQTAYTTAVGLSPSATNRITIVCGPGYYNFGSSAFVMDTQYIDLVSLDGNRSVIFNSSNAGGTISITANDVFVKGVDVRTKNFTIATNLNLLKVENCKGGDFSFGGDPTEFTNPITVSGTFTNCIGGSSSFGGRGEASGTFTDCIGAIGDSGAFGGSLGTASGTFTNCTGGESSFGGGNGTASGTFNSCTSGPESFGGRGEASGTFNSCTSGYNSFGGGNGISSGTFTNCVGGDDTFGGQGTASGTFNFCIGGQRSFGFDGTASGTFNSCIGGSSSFGGEGGTASGTFNSCTGGDYSFGGFGTASGTFTNCVGGSSSFGGGGGVASGTFTDCTGGDYSFGENGTASGTFTNCVGGSSSFGGGSFGTASGTFNSCIGGEYSFGGNGGTLSGKLYYCRLTVGSFQTVSDGGITRLCLDGSNVENNQG